MADRLKDSEDLKLEALFRSEPVHDGGFTDRVLSRVRRRMWIQRLSLPIAFVIGAVIAAKPLMQLANLLPKLADIFPQSLVKLVDVPVIDVFQGTTVILGIMLLGGMMMIGRMLED